MEVGCRHRVRRSLFYILFLFLLIPQFSDNKKVYKGEKPAWAKKDIRDYTDADVERLYDQWEEEDEPLEADELPEYLRPSPPIDLSKIDATNPEAILKMTKKGKTLMAFVTVKGNPNRDELEEMTKLWQTGLMNNHIQCDRFLIDDKRAIYMFRDGSQAWEAKDFLVEQEQCEEVVIENKSYPGKGQPKKTGKSKKSKKEKKKDEL